jgi:DNA-binding CsgD family transcriptional regulator
MSTQQWLGKDSKTGSEGKVTNTSQLFIIIQFKNMARPRSKSGTSDMKYRKAYVTPRQLRSLKAIRSGSTAVEISKKEGVSQSVISGELADLRGILGCRTTVEMLCDMIADEFIK